MPPVFAAIGAIASGIAAAVSAAVTALTAAGLVSFASLGAFLASPIGSLIVGIGLQLVSSLFVKKNNSSGNTQTTTMEAGRVNVRMSEPPRWMLAGLMRSGGGVVFGEFDESGYFWYVVIHSDTILGNITRRYFDDVRVTIDENNWVNNDEFCLDQNYNTYSGSGTKVPYFRMWTTTYSASNPTPPAIAALKTAFPGSNGWTDDHKLVGTTYSVVTIRPLGIENRYKIYRWRGPIGIGEPAVSIVGEWAKCYDPRDNTQILGNKSTYKFSRNPMLIWSWFRTQKYGRNKPESSINWNKIAEQANICDQIVFDKNGEPHVRYRCATAIPESKERATAEQEILLSCDGQIVFDEDGKTWVRVGYYYTPTISFSRNRDIAAMESVEAVDGESETQGVIVRFIDPDADYQTQPAAAWDNPLYYVEGETPKYLYLDVLACQDHNQAMRLAKAFGYRSQPTHKIVPVLGLRALKARQERIVNLNYDNTFSGDYEIVAPIELDQNGIFLGVALTPVDASRWLLSSGEEKNKPVYTSIITSNNLQLPTGVTVNYNAGRIEAHFDAPLRIDWLYKFQYKLATETIWSDMTVDMTNYLAYSGAVLINQLYEVRYRTVSSAGKSTEWLDEPETITTILLTLSGSPVITGTVDEPYTSWSISVSGGDAPYAFYDLFERLPPGITINVSTGEVSGIPTEAGTFSNIIIRVSDSNGVVTNSTSFTITISP